MEQQLKNYYTENGLYRAIDIFNFPDENKISYRIMAYRYLFQYRHKYNKSPPKIEIENQILSLYNSLNNNVTPEKETILLELMDIMLEYTNRGNNLLVNRRVYEEKIKPKIETVYTDRQNVHKTSINENVKKCAINLCDKYIDYNKNIRDEWKIVVNEFRNIYKNKYDKELDKIETDVGTFNIGLNIQTIFVALWRYIKQHKYRDELYKRLSSELDEMKGVCLTGHLSRLMNTIQGFTDDKNLEIHITDGEQMESVIKRFVDKVIIKDEDMFDKMLSENKEDKEKIYIYIMENIVDNIEKWKIEYKLDNKIYGFVERVIKKYIDCK